MPKTALEHFNALLEGNARFAARTAQIEHARLALRQEPFAVILGCSDSRVPVETIFDRGPGEIFVVRIAGNIVHDEGLASIEYAVDVLATPLVLVLGHSGCGAVAAAMDHLRYSKTFPGQIGQLVEAIIPSVRATRSSDGDGNDLAWWERAVADNVRRNVATLTERSDVLKHAVRERRILVTGAVYDLQTGCVRSVDETN